MPTEIQVRKVIHDLDSIIDARKVQGSAMTKAMTARVDLACAVTQLDRIEALYRQSKAMTLATKARSERASSTKKAKASEPTTDQPRPPIIKSRRRTRRTKS